MVLHRIQATHETNQGFVVGDAPCSTYLPAKTGVRVEALRVNAVRDNDHAFSTVTVCTMMLSSSPGIGNNQVGEVGKPSTYCKNPTIQSIILGKVHIRRSHTPYHLCPYCLT